MNSFDGSHRKIVRTPAFRVFGSMEGYYAKEKGINVQKRKSGQ